jgi:integrase
MVRADLPYTYRVSRKLADGKFKDYWRFRRDGMNTSLPGQPGDPDFHQRYSELMGETAARIALEADRAAADASRTTVAWLIGAYMQSAEFNALAPVTQDDYRSTLETRLLPALGPERFDCIQRSHIKIIRDDVAKTLSARTAHKVKQMASRLYSWADEEDLLPPGFFNPGLNLKRLKGKSKSIEIWSQEEVALFLRHCDAAMKTPILIALYTGQRREDIVRFTWADVQGKVCRVRQNKTDEPLTIPLHPILHEHLESMRTKFGGPILRGADGKPMTPNQLSQALRRAVGKIDGMPRNRSMHGLRYASAGMLEEAGCTVTEISSIIGHRTYQMAIKYASQRREAEA